MFRKIIVGCNGEAPGRDALALASVLGRSEQADVLALGVHQDPLLPFPIVLSRHSTLHEDCERALSADCSAVAPGAHIRAVPSASPARALRHAVEHGRADLLVLGSARGTADGRVRAGRHARQLLHGVPCAVALAPIAFATHPAEPRRILVGYDGSTEAADALACGQLIAGASDGSLRVLTAIDPLPPAATGGFEAVAYLPQEWEATVELRRRHARELLDARIVATDHVETDVVEGDPGAALCEASQAADLLVVGSRHWGPFARLALGGTAEYVCRHACCPVLVIPRRQTEAP